MNNTSSTIIQAPRSSKILIENNDDNDSEEQITFLKQLHIKPGHQHQHNMNKNNLASPSPISTSNQTPTNLLEFKQQRSIVEADRRKRLITRIISIVGLLIILLCAVIVTLTLKMAPKIDELVRTKTGVQPSVHFITRITTSFTPLSTTTTTISSDLYNITTNNSSVTRSTYRTRPRSFT